MPSAECCDLGRLFAVPYGHCLLAAGLCFLMLAYAPPTGAEHSPCFCHLAGRLRGMLIAAVRKKRGVSIPHS